MNQNYNVIFQISECDHDYVKDCYIKYAKAAVNSSVLVCRRPLVRDCGVESGEELCSTHYETECTTQERVNQVIKPSLSRQSMTSLSKGQ